MRFFFQEKLIYLTHEKFKYACKNLLQLKNIVYSVYETSKET